MDVQIFFLLETRRKLHHNEFSLPKQVCLKVKLLGNSGTHSRRRWIITQLLTEAQ